MFIFFFYFKNVLALAFFFGSTKQLAGCGNLIPLALAFLFTYIQLRICFSQRSNIHKQMFSFLLTTLSFFRT